MFENPSRGRQASNFKKNVPKILHLKYCLPNRYFPKIDVGCPRLYEFAPKGRDFVSVVRSRAVPYYRGFFIEELY